jgi:hypothetical protein
MLKYQTIALKEGDKILVDGKVETITDVFTARGRVRSQSQIPDTIGAAVDALYSTRLLRLEVQKEVEKLAKFEAELKDHLIQTLPKSDSTGAAGKLARVTIVPKTVPTVEDWDKLYAYVRKTKDFSLLQKRLSDAAVVERWDAGKEVPGIGRFTVVGVSVNKL